MGHDVGRPLPMGSRGQFFSAKKYCNFVCILSGDHNTQYIAVADSVKRFNNWNVSSAGQIRTESGTATNRSKQCFSLCLCFSLFILVA